MTPIQALTDRRAGVQRHLDLQALEEQFIALLQRALGENKS